MQELYFNLTIISDFRYGSKSPLITIPPSFKSVDKIKNVQSPVLVMHGKKDKIVPFQMGKKIYDLANPPKFYYFSEYDDHMMEYNKTLLEKLKLFIQSLN